jgi:RimJ/RimL family protein N-acetyltransferase
VPAFRPFELDEPIRTRRLVLRPLRPDDLDDVHAYQSLEEVCKYLLFEPRSRDEVATKLERYATARRLAADGDFLQLGLVLADPAGRNADGDSGRVIGDSYFTIASIEHLRGEIGWSIHPDFAGQGYAAEAANAVLGLAFDTMGLHRVFAELDPRNAASIALCKRLGMREEAYFVEEMMFKGAWADTGIYAILESEWRARQVANERGG